MVKAKLEKLAKKVYIIEEAARKIIDLLCCFT